MKSSQNNYKKAFSLVELLISILLLSLLVATAMFSFRFLINAVDKHSIELPEYAISYELLNKNISNLYFYLVKTDKNKQELFFKEQEDSIIFISNYPLFYKEVVISKIIKENSKLFYYESPLFNKKQNYQDPVILDELHFKKELLNNIDTFSITIKKTEKDIQNPYQITFEFKDSIVGMQTWIFSIKSNFSKLQDFIKEKENLL